MFVLECDIDLFYKINNPLLTKKMMEMGIFKIFKQFLK